jgi:hypothetical protein
MGDVVNLNRARKDRAAAERKAQAAGNRVKHGRGKAETSLSQAEKDLAARKLDSHRREDD